MCSPAGGGGSADSDADRQSVNDNDPKRFSVKMCEVRLMIQAVKTLTSPEGVILTLAATPLATPT